MVYCSILLYSCHLSSRCLFSYRGLLLHLIIIIIVRAGQHVGSQLPNQGSNLRPLQWKHGVVTTGPPGKSSATLQWRQGQRESPGSSRKLVSDYPAVGGQEVWILRATPRILGASQEPSNYGISSEKGLETQKPREIWCVSVRHRHGGAIWWSRQTGGIGPACVGASPPYHLRQPRLCLV